MAESQAILKKKIKDLKSEISNLVEMSKGVDTNSEILETTSVRQSEQKEIINNVPSEEERSSLSECTPTVIRISKQEEDKKIQQLGSFNAQLAFLSMIQVLEKQHDKGPILCRQPSFKLPPDDSLNIFKLEEIEQQILKVEKKVKLVSRKLLESRKEKAELIRRIEFLENRLIQRSKEEMIATFMKEQPTAKDIENLQLLQEKLIVKSKSSKDLKQLQKQRETLNKILKNAETIISDSSVIKKPRHIIIVEPNIAGVKDKSIHKISRAQDEKDNARSVLGSRENIGLIFTSVDELAGLKPRESVEGEFNEKQKSKRIKKALDDQDAEMENESPSKDPWTGLKLKIPESQVSQETEEESEDVENEKKEETKEKATTKEINKLNNKTNSNDATSNDSGNNEDMKKN
ncbi:myosin-11-like [Cimex lectularius]|uniref:Uncharacterized protein n=1 Tax=Cimex lectularius TaxID=79782 RepID=A0A8I6RNZ7_CIMLE|nr:myosin-11-like [Cimex lectularius]XP_014248767.1 myosin-11-like [Cimex lectularius]